MAGVGAIVSEIYSLCVTPYMHAEMMSSGVLDTLAA